MSAYTKLLVAGKHPRVAMELLGHTQIRTTMDISSHVMPALAREAANRMDAILFGPNPSTDGHGPRRSRADCNQAQPE